MSRTFNIFFKMPKDNELLIAAWAAISAFDMKLRQGAWPITVTLLMKETWLSKLIIPSIYFIVEDEEELKGMRFDLAVDMSDERVLEFKQYGKSAADCFSIFLGFDHVSELVSFKQPEYKNDLCIITWNENSENYSFSLFMKLSESSSFSPIAIWEEDTDTSSIDAILSSRIVAGRRSVYTYLASCLRRHVIEFYPLDQYPREFLAKWSNPKYKMICLDTTDGIEKNYQLFNKTIQGVLNAIPR